MRKTARILAILLLAVFMAASVQAKQPDVLYQYSTLETLLAGVYDGQATFAHLAKRGDLGLGTFNALDGEMVAVDGKFYQVRSDGKITQAAPSQKTPFANLVFFRPERSIKINKPLAVAALQAMIDKNLPSKNLFYAFRITGLFGRVKVRSVPAQKPPYPPLTQVVKHQSVWNYKNIDGTVVGFRFPPYVKGLNVTGYHLHFLDKTRKKGGHLLDGAAAKVVVEIDYLYAMDLELPKQGAFLKTRLGKDTAKAVHKVEK